MGSHVGLGASVHHLGVVDSSFAGAGHIPDRPILQFGGRVAAGCQRPVATVALVEGNQGSQGGWRHVLKPIGTLEFLHGPAGFRRGSLLVR